MNWNVKALFAAMCLCMAANFSSANVGNTTHTANPKPILNESLCQLYESIAFFTMQSLHNGNTAQQTVTLATNKYAFHIGFELTEQDIKQLVDIADYNIYMSPQDFAGQIGIVCSKIYRKALKAKR